MVRIISEKYLKTYNISYKLSLYIKFIYFTIVEFQTKIFIHEMAKSFIELIFEYVFFSSV